LTCSGIISQVIPGSIADEIGLVSGDRLLSVNGEAVRDLIDLSFALAEEYVEIIIEKANGAQEIYEIEKDFDEDLGIEFESAVFDKIRQCANRCIFCFVDQMPPGMRKSLYVKDDDYRLSFLYGNFITLTNLGPNDFDRIRNLHLSPLYVSVHTTDEELRIRMLGNKRAGEINRHLQKLINNGVELHTQVVLCPDFNDGDNLNKTIQDLYSMYPHILSLAIVPVGLTRYRENCYPLRTFQEQTARRIIATVDQWQKRCRKETGKSFVYLSDEFYVSAGCDIPEYNFYDGFPQLENGVGIVRSFLREWEEATQQFSSSYTTPHYIDIVCGASAHKILEPLIQGMKISNLLPRLVPVENEFFGADVTVTGLLTGRDIIAALAKLSGPRTGIIIPGVALRKGEQVFLDELKPGDIESKLQVPVRTAYFAKDLYQLLCAWR
jgi:putative radical SAM enzyme (TIGR03279 family)